MKRRGKIITALTISICIVLLLGTVISFAKSMADAERQNYMKTASPMDGQPEIITLSNGSNQARGAGASSGYKLLLDGSDWLLAEKGENDLSKAYKVSVPSSLSGALYKAGVIADPTVGTNDAAAKALGQKDWYYYKSFNYEGSGNNVYLCFEGVADRMEVFLNGEKVGTHQGMFGGPYIDVSSVVKKGANELTVHLLPVIDYTKTVVFNCSYAWHYADLPPIGIWNSVSIEDRPDAVLDHPFITTVSHETGTMDLSIDVSDVTGQGRKIGGTIFCTISPKNFSGGSYSFEYRLPDAEKGGDRNVRLRFDLPEFKLWWPNGYGEQNLYTMETLFVDDSGGRSYDVTTFGVRTLKMVATGRKEAANMYNRTAVFNGKALFLKGADWCTIDAVMNFTRADYDRILFRAKDQGLNVFRSWGGGMCETDDFYDLCDEYGLCVYQEWPCCWDSQKTQPSDVLYETVILNTKRIRNRASLLVYGGGNEGEAPVSDKVMNKIGTLTYRYDGTRDFWRQDGGVGSYGITHDHIHWGGETPDHYAEVYYATTNNLHEYGLDSMMNYESVAKFATQKEMEQWPIDQKGTIAYHTATFNGMKGWNPTPYGYDIDTFIHYASQFVEVTDLKSLITGSQIAQMMADYPAALNSRINFPNQSMVMFYKFNDVYPGASWSVVDYYGAPKLAYWFLQDAYAPLTAALRMDRYDTYNKTDRSVAFPVHVLDDADALRNSNWEVVVKAYDERLNVVKESRYTGSGSVNMTKQAGEFTLTAAQTDHAPLFIVTTLYKDGKAEGRTYIFMNAGKDPGCLFAIPAADVDVETGGNSVTFKNNSDIPAIAVNIDAGSASDTFRPSDNYFWLEPGESYTVSVNDASLISGFGGFNFKDKNDTSAPKAPENLKAAAETFDTVTLSWNKPDAKAAIRYYELYLNGNLYALVKGTADKYVVEGLSELSEYDLELIAVDNGMNRSDKSKTVSAKTKADNIAPYAKRIEITGPDGIKVWFSRKVDPESASNTDYYLLNAGGTVTAATPGEDGYSVDLAISGYNGDFTGKTLTVIGVKDDTSGGNRSRRTLFRLDNTVTGYWPFDDEADVIEDASGYHSVPGNAADAEYVEGFAPDSGKAIRPVKGNIILTESDVVFTDTVISFWFKGGKNFSGFRVLLCKGQKVPGHFEIYANEGDLKLYCPDICDSSFGVNLNNYMGEWIHLCFTYDGQNLNCWINGEKEGRVRLSRDIDRKSFPLVLGSLPGGSFTTDGVFDELLILHSEAGEELVKQLYEGSFRHEISFEKAAYKLRPEDETDIKVIRKNVDASELLTWSTSDGSVAAVDQSGHVTAAGYGSAIITARTADGRYVEGCVVDVGDFANEDTKTPEGVNVMLIVGIVLGVVALALVVFVVILILKKGKKNRTE
ncbi:MAG: hypothetical protein IKH41_05600 [Clostridia bacterium]|nr:hypothetical protein [Clostridia bacterium]